MTLYHRAAIKKEERTRRRKPQTGLVAAETTVGSALANMVFAMASWIFLRSLETLNSDL